MYKISIFYLSAKVKLTIYQNPHFWEALVKHCCLFSLVDFCPANFMSTLEAKWNIPRGFSAFLPGLCSVDLLTFLVILRWCFLKEICLIFLNILQNCANGARTCSIDIVQEIYSTKWDYEQFICELICNIFKVVDLITSTFS